MVGRPVRTGTWAPVLEGNIMVGGLGLRTKYPVLDVDMGPGDYNVRVIGRWQDNEIAYEFGLSVPRCRRADSRV